MNYGAIIPLRGSRDVKPQKQSLSSLCCYLNMEMELQACHPKAAFF